MESKEFRGETLYFKVLEPYDGPITLMYRPEKTIFAGYNCYVVEIKGQYYQLLKVEYLGKEYDILAFIHQYPDVLEF